MAKKRTDGVYKIVEVVGVSEKSWEDAGRNAVETAAEFATRFARSRSNKNGYEGGERKGRGISHARVALLQIRGLTLSR